MAKKQKNGSGSGKNTAAVHMLIEGIAIAVIAVVFIIFSRGYINYSNRMDFIARRLEAYPRMRENHLSELEQMQTLWLTSEYNSLARQAAFLYDRSDAQSDEAENLGHISEMLGTAKVSVIPPPGRKARQKQRRPRIPIWRLLSWRTAAAEAGSSPAVWVAAATEAGSSPAARVAARAEADSSPAVKAAAGAEKDSRPAVPEILKEDSEKEQ